ncbi:hypothetical protein ACNOYE_23925 [Nannocystaceae bacterium ST9]
MRRLRGLAPLLALGLLAPSDARAGNEAHPRTPVLWPDSPCGVVVDRGVETSLHVEYAIPFEDTQLGPDELADSRTHQFFALCRQRAMTDLLPNWISLDDVARAEQAGLIATGSVASSAVLDTSADWAGCFVRITADDQRRPISFAAADQGVDWALAEVPIGVWQVAGYTFEPALNLWRGQPSFVKIVDDPDDPAQDLPAAQIVETGAWWWSDQANPIELCVDARMPATAIFEWAPLSPELVWTELDRATIEQDGRLTATPKGAVLSAAEGANVQVEGLLRVRLIDALDREFVAHHSESVIFERCLGPCGGDPPDDSEDSGEPEDPEAREPIDDCACSHQRTTPPAWSLAWLALIGGAMRPRVRKPA